MDGDGRELKDAAIYVIGPSIAWVGLTADLPDKFKTADTTLSLQDHVVLPGLTNTHHHTFQNLTRCIAQVMAPLLSPALALLDSMTSFGVMLTQ